MLGKKFIVAGYPNKIKEGAKNEIRKINDSLLKNNSLVKIKTEDSTPKPSTLLAPGLAPRRKPFLEKMWERSWVGMTALNLKQSNTDELFLTLL